MVSAGLNVSKIHKEGGEIKILYNKKYGGNVLYGGGIFPFWLYLKFFGRPVYKFCRKKLNLPPFIALSMAHTLGGVAHVFVPIFNGSYFAGFIKLLISYMVFTPLFWVVHKTRRTDK